MAKIRMKQNSNVFGKILLAILFVVVVVGACIYLVTMPTDKLSNKLNSSSQSTENTSSSQQTGGNTDKQSESDVNKLNKENIPFDIKKGGTFIFHVGLLECVDTSVFTALESFEYYNRLFNEQDFSNDFTSVYEYYYLQSKGKLKVLANISYLKVSNTCSSIANLPYNYEFEKQMFDKIVEKGEVKVFYGQFNAGVVMLPATATANTVSWAHTWLQKGLMVASKSQAITPILCHEIGHVFGLYDLYTGVSSFDAVYTYELMGQTDRSILSPINAYHRSEFNWLSESDYEDDNSSDIETISKSGTYTLKPSTSLNGVVAYKFAENSTKTESFYAEYRVATGNGVSNALPNGDTSGLYIYRINKNKKGNLLAQSQSQCEVYAFYPSTLNSKNKLFQANNSIGGIGSLTSLFYSDGTRPTVIIENIKIVGDSISFTIDFSEVDNKQYSGTVLVQNSKLPLSDVEVYVNGTYATKTDANGNFCVVAEKGDNLSFKCSGYEIQSIVLGSNTVLTVKAVYTIGYIKITSGYSNFTVALYVNNALALKVSSGSSKSKTIYGHIKLDGSEKYAILYTRDSYAKLIYVKFEYNYQTIEISVDPYIDEDKVVRNYSGVLTLKTAGAYADVDVYVNNVYVTKTSASGNFDFNAKKGQVVSFRKNDIEIATTTLDTNTKLNIVSEYFVGKLVIQSGCNGYSLNIYDNDQLVASKVNCDKVTNLDICVKYNETKNIKIAYVRGNYTKQASCEISIKNKTQQVKIDDNGTNKNDKSIWDKITDGIDFFTYNMSEGFKELGRRLKFW